MGGQARPARPARGAGRSGGAGAAETGGQASMAETGGQASVAETGGQASVAETGGQASVTEITEAPEVAAGAAGLGGVSGMVRPGRPGSALGHPLRVALLALLARRATLTATEAARELGESSGACSFHLRQLERYGHVQEAPGPRGRVRPWRLVAAQAGPPAPADEFGDLARELENEGYRRWLAGRHTAPGWRDETFSAVVYLTPDELTEVAAAIRSVIASFAGRADPSQDPPAPGAEPAAASRPGAGAGPVMPVGVVARMFPLLPASSDG